MKEVIYNGEETTLGRHGLVKKGDRLHLGYDEWLSVRGNERFTPVRVRKTAKQEQILPAGAEQFDLTQIPWGEPKVVNWLKKRKTSILRRIIAAMKEIGVEVADTEHDNSAALVDCVLFAADMAGWMD